MAVDITAVQEISDTTALKIGRLCHQSTYIELLLQGCFLRSLDMENNMAGLLIFDRISNINNIVSILDEFQKNDIFDELKSKLWTLIRPYLKDFFEQRNKIVHSPIIIHNEVEFLLFNKRSFYKTDSKLGNKTVISGMDLAFIDKTIDLGKQIRQAIFAFQFSDSPIHSRSFIDSISIEKLKNDMSSAIKRND